MTDKPKTKPQRPLDPRAQAAIDHLRNQETLYYGPILSEGLPAIVPLSGERRCWQDAISVFVLALIIGVYRVKKGQSPFWSGHLYKIKRRDLANQFGCDPDMISKSLKRLESWGFILRERSTVIDDDGKPSGTNIFVCPLMHRVKDALDYFHAHGKAMNRVEWFNKISAENSLNTASAGAELQLKSASTPSESGAYLNCVLMQHKPVAKSDDMAMSQRRSHLGNDDQQSCVVAEGGGEADDYKYMQVPQPPMAALDQNNTAAAPTPSALAPDHARAATESLQPDASTDDCPSCAPAARWTCPPLPNDIPATEESETAWRRACRLCEMWAESIVRLNYASVCVPTKSDRNKANKFFTDYPQITSFWALAVAIDAWWVGQSKIKKGWDKQYCSRQATEIQAFLRHMTSGKLESEIGLSGHQINMFADLRSAFTASELQYYGLWKVPIAAIEPELLWEHSPDALTYYAARKRKPPQEVAAVVANKSDNDDDSEA